MSFSFQSEETLKTNGLIHRNRPGRNPIDYRAVILPKHNTSSPNKKRPSNSDRLTPLPCLPWPCGPRVIVVSVFWSFIADTFSNEQAKRLFGVIAAGGTAGALAGPLLTATLVVHMEPVNLLPVSAALLAWTVVCIHRLLAWQQSAVTVNPAAGAARGHATTDRPAVRAMGGSIFAGIGLVLRSSYLAGIWALISFRLGRRQERMAKAAANPPFDPKRRNPS